MWNNQTLVYWLECAEHFQNCSLDSMVLHNEFLVPLGRLLKSLLSGSPITSEVINPGGVGLHWGVGWPKVSVFVCMHVDWTINEELNEVQRVWAVSSVNIVGESQALPPPRVYQPFAWLWYCLAKIRIYWNSRPLGGEPVYLNRMMCFTWDVQRIQRGSLCVLGQL